MTADASPYREGLAEQRAELDEVRSQITDARAQLVDLQRERQDSRDHRTRVQTLLGLAGAAALVVILGAVSVRDTARETAARTAAHTVDVLAIRVTWSGSL